MIIAIDGPAGVGKSTVAKLVAQKLNYYYFDTGAMYRSITYAIVKNKIDINDEEKVVDFLKNHFKYEILINQDKVTYKVNSEDVTHVIRSNYISTYVSEVSSKEYIRRVMLPWQRAFAEEKDIVVEGRDMGTEVFPNAKLKIFLTAKSFVRAERRFHDLTEQFPQDIGSLNKEKILEEIERRDYSDSTRKVSPLRRAKDAILIDTSNMSINQVVKKIIIKAKNVKKMRFFYKFIRFLSWAFLKVFYRFEVIGEENITKKAAIINANHSSFLDPPIIAAAMQEEIHFLAKNTLFKIKILNSFIKRLNAHPVSFNESNIKTVKIVDSVIKDGNKIVVFPEGKRIESEKMEKLLPGVAFLVSLTKCDIMPIYIHGANIAWGIGKKCPKLFCKIYCIFGKTIRYEEFENLKKEEKIPYILERIQKSINDLHVWANSSFKGPMPK